jgi:hypothetical protein
MPSPPARYEYPFVVTVVTPDPAVARWASQSIDLGDGVVFRPRVIGPEGIPQVTNHDRALREPQLAVLEQRLLSSLLIEKALSEAARKALAMEPQIEQFFSEAHRRSYDRGKAEGKAEGEATGEVKGEAKALMRILKRRGMAITDEQQHQIVTCTDLATLDRWLDRALFVASVDELLA